MSRPTRNTRQTGLTSLQTNDSTHREQQALLEAVDRVRTLTSASSTVTGRRSRPPTYDPTQPNPWRHEETLYDPTAPAWAGEVEHSTPAHRRAVARYSPSIQAYSPTSRLHRLTQTQQQQHDDPSSPLYTWSPSSAVAGGEAASSPDGRKSIGLDDIISMYAQHFSPRMRSLHLLLDNFVESVDSRFDKVNRHLHLLINLIRQLPKRPSPSKTPSSKTPRKITAAPNSPEVPSAPRKPASKRPTTSFANKSSGRQPNFAPATKPVAAATRKSTRAPQKVAQTAAPVLLPAPPTTRQTRQSTRLAAQAAVAPKKEKGKQSTVICALRRPSRR